MRFIYNILFPIVFLFFIPGILFKLIRRPGWKKTFGERFALFSPERIRELQKYRGAVWIHAVSVGETMVALSMLQEWRRREPSRKFVISTTTTTGQELARSKAPKDVAVIFCPIDFIFFVLRTLLLIRPSMLVIFETEIWPNMIAEAARYGAKVALVNARMSDKSCRGYYRWRIFFRPMLEHFNVISVQTEADRQRFAAVAPAVRLEISGNMKFDQQVPENLPEAGLEKYFGQGDWQILLAASTHPGEEELIGNVFQTLQTEFPALRLVIVPRHAERGAEIVAVLKKQGISFRRRSVDDGTEENPVKCLLADTTGEMLKFMNAADVVIMGKSLAGQNEGHNLIEPALLGKPIVTGSILKNFRFVLTALKEKAALVTVDSDDKLEDALRELFRDAELRKTLGEKALQAISQHKGATAKTINILEELF
ncbi:MAG: 3-deoxy-D-manno-octulosonic acid transferase [Victivallaceae bacterium]